MVCGCIRISAAAATAIPTRFDEQLNFIQRHEFTSEYAKYWPTSYQPNMPLIMPVMLAIHNVSLSYVPPTRSHHYLPIAIDQYTNNRRRFSGPTHWWIVLALLLDSRLTRTPLWCRYRIHDRWDVGTASKPCLFFCGFEMSC